MKNFEKEISEILEVDIVNFNDDLKSFDCWDSLTILSIIALSSEIYNVNISSTEVNDAKTIAGLKNLIQSKIK